MVQVIPGRMDWRKGSRGRTVMIWNFLSFNDLDAATLYAIMALRQRVFVVEQNCVYLDADGADPKCLHLIGVLEGQIVAYLRVVPPGVKFAEASIGRVVTAPEARGKGIGRELVTEGIARTHALFPNQPIRIGAQQYLEAFYGSLGFVTQSEPYDEDGIPHVEMLLP